jgi:hypothetical protein
MVAELEVDAAEDAGPARSFAASLKPRYERGAEPGCSPANENATWSRQ